MLNRKFNGLSPERLFLYGLIFLVCLTVLQLPVNEGESFFSLLHADFTDTFMDFFNSIYDANKRDPYKERGVIYPPLTYVYYRLCGLPLSEKNETGEPKDASLWRNSQSGIFTACIVTILTVVLLYKTLIQDKCDSKESRKMVWWVLLGTVPFWFCYDRGNLALQTLLFLAFFVNNYRSENKIIRELSLVSLAVAVAFKIYPVAFGVLLILDKRYKEALRCVVYGIILFFAPFWLFGGSDTISVMIENITKTTEKMKAQGFGYKVNIDNTLAFLMDPFQMKIPDYLPVTVKLVLAAVMIIILLFSKKDWQRYMVLSSVMIVFPGFSYTYTLIFAAIPLVHFLFSKPRTTVMNLMFSLAFLGMFAPFPFSGRRLYNTIPEEIYPLNLTSVISSLSLILMLVLILIDVIGRHKAATARTDAKAYLSFTIILAALVCFLFAGYTHCNQLYEEIFYKTDEGKVALAEQQMLQEIEEAISEYADKEDYIAYFAPEKVFKEEPLNTYKNVRWVKMPKRQWEYSVKMYHDDFLSLLKPDWYGLPKVLMYYTSPPWDPTEDYSETEILDQLYIMTDHLKQFVFDNRYTFIGRYSVKDNYTVYLYINLHDEG